MNRRRAARSAAHAADPANVSPYHQQPTEESVSAFVRSLKTRPALWAALLILFTTAVRLWFVRSGQLNLVQDEAQYWDWTRHLQLTYYSKGPLIAWIIALWTKIFGNTEFGVRFGSILGSTLTQILLYFGVSRLFGRPRTALLTLFVFNTMPLLMALGILMTTDNSFVFFWTGAMFSLYWASLPHHATYSGEKGAAGNLPFILLALCFGVGVLAKYTMLGFIGIAGLYWLGLCARKLCPKGFFKRLAAALAAGLAIGFLPTLIWNVFNHFVGYKHVLYLIGVSGKQSSQFFHFSRFPEYLGSQLGLASPWWTAFMLIGSWAGIRQFFGLAHRNLGLDERQSLLLTLFFLPVWLFFLLWSLHAKVMPNWGTVAYVGGAILAAAALEEFLDRTHGGLIRYRKALIIAAAAVFLIVHVSPVLPLPRALNITLRMKGWEDLGRTVERVKTDAFANPDKVFVFAELYDMTAALAFYVPGQPRTYCAWFDRRMNQYDLWPGPEGKTGWDAVFVAKRDDISARKHLGTMFGRVSEPMHIQTAYDGDPARRFTLFLCYDYNGTWPHEDRSGF